MCVAESGKYPAEFAAASRFGRRRAWRMRWGLLCLLFLTGISAAQVSCEAALDAEGNNTGPGSILMEQSCGSEPGDYVRCYCVPRVGS